MPDYKLSTITKVPLCYSVTCAIKSRVRYVFRYLRNCCLSVVLTLFYTGTVFAQINCSIAHYTGEHGISHGTVTSVLKDGDGFLWLGTWNGLNRFDGKYVKSYRSLYENDAYMENNRIVQLEEIAKHVLLIKTYDKQVYHFDKKTERFTSLSAILEKQYGRKVAVNRIFRLGEDQVWFVAEQGGLYRLLDVDMADAKFHYIDPSAHPLAGENWNTVNFMYCDANQTVWIGTDSGLRAFRQGMEKTLVENGGIRKQTIGLHVLGVAEDQHQLYFGTSNGILFIYNKKTATSQEVKISTHAINHVLLSRDRKEIYMTCADGSLYNYRTHQRSQSRLKKFEEGIRKVWEDSKGNLWLEPQMAGAILWDRSKDKVIYLKTTFDRYESNVAFQCLEDRRGLLWIALKGGGFGYYDDKKEQLITKNDDGAGNYVSFPQQIYNLLYEDDIIWLCSEEKGLIKLQVRFRKTAQDELSAFLKDSGNPEVRSLLYDSKQRLWVGTKEGKLIVREDSVYRSAPIAGIHGLDLSGVYSMLEDKENNIWIATKNRGVFIASPQDAGRNSYTLKNFHKKNSRLGADHVYSILMDEDYNIWLGTFGAGIFKVKKTADSFDFQSVSFQNTAYPRGSFDKIRHLSTDDRGNIWIATTYGLLVYDRKEKARLFRSKHGKKTGLGANDLQYILPKSDHEMWVCTSGGGVSKITGNPFAGLTFQNYTVDDGLSNDYVLSGVEDADGNLWFATEGGLSKYDHKTGYFFTHDSHTGGMGFSFAEKTVTKTAFGDIIWGTTKGILEISPNSIAKEGNHGNLVFSNLFVNNRELISTPGISGQEYNIQYTSQLLLDHDQNNISIDYTIIDYQNQQHTYLYRLDGLDTNWHSNQHLNRVTFTNLKPGEYRLEIKEHGDLYESPPYKSLAIVISPPWWRSSWAYMLYTVLFFLGFVLCWRILSTMMSLKNKIQIEKEVSALKMTFFTNVSHELRTPLTLILSPVKQLLSDRQLADEQLQYVNMIKRNAERLEYFVDQLLDLRKLQENKFDVCFSRLELIALLQEILETFQPLAKERLMTVVFQSDVESLEVDGDRDQLKTIFINILSNAFKYSPNQTTITMNVERDMADNRVTIKTSDEGKGMDESNPSNIFELFYSESALTSEHGKGSGIGLALTKELVDLHQGQIQAVNNERKGLTISVTLPIVQFPSTDPPLSSANPSGHKAIAPFQQTSARHTSTQKDEIPLVLIVEDNEDLRSFLTLQLQCSYSVLCAEDGLKGLELAKTQSPDLIVSDIMMPNMDGITMLKHIRETVSISHIPVVLLSVKHAVQHQIEGLNYGADCYITKPFNIEFLLSSIDNLLKRRKAYFESLVKKRNDILKPSDLVITDSDEQFLQEVVKVVESKMSDPEFNIDMVADSLNLGRNTFHKKFKSLTKIVPVEFVRDMRLERAYQLLSAGSDNISQVAYEVGFNNPKYFSTCFRIKFGISPKEFVKNNKKQVL